jgi:adenylate cyclase
MLTFRIAITAAVMAFITALTACLVFIQIATFHRAAREAASAAMDAASANTLSRLEADVSELGTLVRVLSASPSLADSDDRSEVDGAVELFKTALLELPQGDSLYVGYDNGCWLQVRRLDVLNPTERQKLEAPEGAVWNVNLVRRCGEYSKTQTATRSSSSISGTTATMRENGSGTAIRCRATGRLLRPPMLRSALGRR